MKKPAKKKTGSKAPGERSPRGTRGKGGLTTLRNELGKGAERFLGKTFGVTRSASGGPTAPHPLEESGFSARIYISELPLDSIKPSKDQPRKVFREEPLAELADSIRSKGVLKPVLVFKTARVGEYSLSAGERRWRAARIAGLQTIPAIIRDDLQDSVLISVIENVQRENLDPFEECLGYDILLKEGSSQSHIAAITGKHKSHISKCIKVAEFLNEYRILHDITMLRMGNGKPVSLEHLYEISMQPDFSTSLDLLRQIIPGKLTRDEVRGIRRSPVKAPVLAWKQTYPKIIRLFSRVDFTDLKSRAGVPEEREKVHKEIDDTINVLNLALAELQGIKDRQETSDE